MKTHLLTLLLVLTSCPLFFAGASEPAKGAPKRQFTPTMADLPYGPDPKQQLDFYQAPSAKPTPLVFHIHGGGWVQGDKNTISEVNQYLNAGISVVSINYRFIQQAIAAGVKPPIKWPMDDATRALQFVRHNAKAWNIDTKRIAATGGSAGACSSLWLAFHDDLAEPASPDPIARESTRLLCAAVYNAQTTLDPLDMQKATPNSKYGGHAFGFFPNPGDIKTRDLDFASFLAKRDEVMPFIKRYSPISHLSPEDPPVFLTYNEAPAMGKTQKDPTHSANFGVILLEACKKSRVQCDLVYPGAPPSKFKTIPEYLISTLTSS